VKNLLKNLAGVLVGLLFAVTAAFAISGGPVFPPAKPDLTGSFSGVLVPNPSPSPTVTVSPTPSPTPNDPRNSLGVFSISVPSSQAALATGTFVLFSHGRVFSGKIQGEADSTNAKLRAILQGPTPAPTPPPPVAENITGTMTAHARIVTNTRFASSGVQLRGNAVINFDEGGTNPASTPPNAPIILRTEFFKVRGFKQASAVNTPTPTPTP
jgi:hypothetical protein